MVVRWDVQERWEPQQILLEEEAKEMLLPWTSESQARDSQQPQRPHASAKRTTRGIAHAVPCRFPQPRRCGRQPPFRLGSRAQSRRALHSVVAPFAGALPGKDSSRELHNGGADSEAPMRDRRGRAGLEEAQVTGAAGLGGSRQFRFSRRRRRGCFFPQGFAVSSSSSVLADQGSPSRAISLKRSEHV
jgi:hypothetical protein